jgi:hypothetical protein
MSSFENSKSSDSASKPSQDKSTEESGANLYYEASKQFTQSFIKAVIAPLKGSSELFGITSPESATATETKADQFGTMAGTAFDAIGSQLLIRHFAPSASKIASSIGLNTGLGFLQPTEEGSFKSHLNGAIVGFGTGAVMSGADFGLKPASTFSRLLSGTISSTAGGITNVELSSKLQTGEFASLGQLESAATSWAAVGAVLGGIREGAGAIRFKATPDAPVTPLGKGESFETPTPKPDVITQTAAPTAESIKPGYDVSRLIVDKPPPLTDLPPVSQQAVPSEPAESIAARIRRVAQDQSFYSRVKTADTYMKCLLFSRDLSDALRREKIDHIMVATTDDSLNHMPMHNFILAKDEAGKILHVDPTISQFVPNFKDVFVGTKDQLLDVAKTSVGDIRVWDKITDNRTDWSKVWADRPLLYPKRFVEPTPETQEDFAQKWGAANVEMYRDHLTGVVQQTLKNPDVLQYADREFPPEFVVRLKDALAKIKGAENPVESSSAETAEKPQRSILRSIELPER